MTDPRETVSFLTFARGASIKYLVVPPDSKIRKKKTAEKCDFLDALAYNTVKHSKFNPLKEIFLQAKFSEIQFYSPFLQTLQRFETTSDRSKEDFNTCPKRALIIS